VLSFTIRAELLEALLYELVACEIGAVKQEDRQLLPYFDQALTDHDEHVTHCIEGLVEPIDIFGFQVLTPVSSLNQVYSVVHNNPYFTRGSSGGSLEDTSEVFQSGTSFLLFLCKFLPSLFSENSHYFSPLLSFTYFVEHPDLLTLLQQENEKLFVDYNSRNVAVVERFQLTCKSLFASSRFQSSKKIKVKFGEFVGKFLTAYEKDGKKQKSGNVSNFFCLSRIFGAVVPK